MTSGCCGVDGPAVCSSVYFYSLWHGVNPVFYSKWSSELQNLWFTSCDRLWKKIFMQLFHINSNSNSNSWLDELICQVIEFKRLHSKPRMSGFYRYRYFPCCKNILSKPEKFWIQVSNQLFISWASFYSPFESSNFVPQTLSRIIIRI